MNTTFAALFTAVLAIASTALAIDRPQLDAAQTPDELAFAFEAGEHVAAIADARVDDAIFEDDDTETDFYEGYSSGAAGDGCYCPNYCTKGTEGVDGICRVRKPSGRFLTKCAGGNTTPTCPW